MKYAREITISSTANSPGVNVDVDGVRVTKLTLDHATNFASVLKLLVNGMRHTNAGVREHYTIRRTDSVLDE